MMKGAGRNVGMDKHRVAAEVVPSADGDVVKPGRVAALREKGLEQFPGRKLMSEDYVEAVGNASPTISEIVM